MLLEFIELGKVLVAATEVGGVQRIALRGADPFEGFDCRSCSCCFHGAAAFPPVVAVVERFGACDHDRLGSWSRARRVFLGLKISDRQM